MCLIQLYEAAQAGITLVPLIIFITFAHVINSRIPAKQVVGLVQTKENTSKAGHQLVPPVRISARRQAERYRRAASLGIVAVS